MTDEVQAYRGLSPYLTVNDAAAAIAFYARAFGAEETQHYDHDRRVGHSTLSINGSDLMLADEFPEYAPQVGAQSPKALGGTTVTVSLAVDDVDAWFERAIGAGATALRPPTDEFYGRHGKLRDPFGHVWSLTGPTKTG